MERENKNLNFRYFILQVLFWGAAVVYYAYMTQILQHKNYTEVEIGILNGVKLLVGVIFQVWIGAYADKNRYRVPLKNLIGLLALLTGILNVALLAVGHNFWIMFFISAGFGVTFTTLQPLIDSLTLLYGNHGEVINYAKGRMGGSISWAFLCILAGVYCDQMGVGTFPLGGLIFVVFLAYAAFRLPWEKISEKNAVNKKAATKSTKEKPHSVLFLLKNYPAFTVFLVGSTVMFMGYNFGSTFLIDVFRGLGGNNTHFGIAQFVLAISEVPSAIIILKLRNKIPIKYMMVCCAFFMALKNAIPVYASSISVVIAAQACEMLGLGLFYAGSIYFIEENIPSADIVKATTLISVATVGIGEGTAAFMCGVIRKNVGLYGLMKTGAIVNGLAVIIFIVMCKIRTSKK